MTAHKTVIAAAVVSFLGLFAPIKAMALATIALCAADLVTGLIAAKKAGEPILSGKLRRTLVKVLVYEGTLLLTFTVQKWLLQDALPVVNWAAGVVGLVELKSNLENLNRISGQDLLKALLDKLTAAQDKPQP